MNIPPEAEIPLSARQLQIRIGERVLCRRLDLEFLPGQCWGLLGRNAAGKTTLLHTLAGLRPAAAGQVLLDDRPILAQRRRAIARRLGLLLQERAPAFPASVRDTVLTGRYPHLGFWRGCGPNDHALADDAIRQAGLAGLETRNVQTLSGGERQRTAIAVLLAQAAQMMLLDEPVTHLDLREQERILRLCRDLADRGRLLIMSLHDPNQALRHCTHLLMLHRGRALHGETVRIGTQRLLSRLYAQPLTALRGPRGPVMVPY